MTRARDPSQPVCIGVLHLGPRESGINRDGRTLASELRLLPRVLVIEHEARLDGGGLVSVSSAFGALRKLRVADVTLVPYSCHRLWARGRLRLVQLAMVHLGLRRRTVTVLHDLYAPKSRRELEWWALTVCSMLSRGFVIHGEHERSALATIPGSRLVAAIPLPLESRSLPERLGARSALGVGDDVPLLGMLGWIHPRKNCEVAIRALSHLSANTRLWLIGSPPDGDEHYLRRLRALAVELGVDQRVDITGYLSETALEQRLAAIDVGLCPYRDAAASASISTLLGARRAVVCSDLPLTREFRTAAPSVVTISENLEPEAFAAAIRSVFIRPPGEDAFEVILDDRSPAAVADAYRQILTAEIGTGFSVCRSAHTARWRIPR